MAWIVKTLKSIFLVHFPLGFSFKDFQNFQKNFFAQNYIKRYFRYLVFPPQNRGPVYAPIRHTAGLEIFWLKIRIYPQMRKIDVCAWWVHILGVGCRQNKLPYHTCIPYKYWLLTLSQKKSYASSKYSAEMPFFWRLSFKALHFTPLNPQRTSGG